MQRAGVLGELKADRPLACDGPWPAAREVLGVGLAHLVAGDVDRINAQRLEPFDHVLREVGPIRLRRSARDVHVSLV